MSRYPLTPSQTVGPFFHGALLRSGAVRHDVAGPDAAGERIRIEGRVFDGERAAVPDAMIEIWQADRFGRYRTASNEGAPEGTAFLGFGRCGTDESGAFWFDTIRPGRVPFDETAAQAPHISVAVFARGLLNHLYTRLYFADDAFNAVDPVLALVPVERRTSLMARPEPGVGQTTYRFDIVLQGADETVFFEFERRPPSSPTASR